MSSHFLEHSVKWGWSWRQRYLIIAFSILVPFSSGCSPLPDDMSTDSPELRARQKVIRQLTDKILLTLAMHNFQKFELFLDPKPQLRSGTEAARLLLGDHAHTILLDRWDAQQIKVSFSNERLRATAQVEVSYRLSPNRRPKHTLFTFRFRRSHPKAAWLLYLP